MFCLLAAFGLASALVAQETGNSPIVRIGEVEYSDFGTFFTAFQAIPANTPTEVTLLADVVVPGYVPVAEGQVIDFDLNGHRFETTTQPDNASRHYYAINNYGTLTIDDSSTGKTGVIYARGVQNLGAGTLTVKGGRIVSCDENGGAAIWNEATLTITGGTFTTEFVGTPSDDYGPGCLNNQGTALITGGTFMSDNRRTYAIISTGKLEITPAEGSDVTVFGAHGALSSDGGTAVVNGGSYTSTEYYGLYVSNDGRNSETMQAAVTVNGGTFDGKTYSVWIGSDVNDPVNSTILITGGTFLDPLNRQDVAREDAIVITGGTFSVAPPAEFYPEGYLPVLTEEGTYEVSDTAAVASVTTESGTIGYPSLAAAVNANKQGQTITLLKDLENQGAITIWSAGQETVIDLNGHTITFRNDESGDHRFQLLEGALTLTGTGTVTESKPAFGPMIIWASAEDAPNQCVLNVGPGVTLKGYQGVMIQGSNDNLQVGHGVSVTVEGKIVTMPASEDDPGCGVYINGQLQDTEGNVPKIVLAEGSSITTNGTGIYAAGYAEWTLAGDITAQEPLSIKCGTFDITGGTYHANGPFNDPAEANGNGSEPTGAAVSITTNDGYAPKTVVNITGGTFTSENGYAFYEGIAKNADGTPAAEASTAVIAISGGTFKGSTTNGAIKDSSAIAITTAENKKVITGGAFSAKPDEAYLAEYYVAEDEAGADELFAVSPTFDPTWYNTEATAFVIQNVPDLLAFARVVNTDRDTFAGKTVTLAANLDLAGVAWTPIGEGNVGGASKNNGFFAGTFDGQNHTIANVSASQTGTSPGAGLFGWVRGATIKDLSVSGNHTSKESAVGIVGAVQGGTVMLNGCVNHAAVTAWMNHSDAVGALCAGGIVGDAQGGSVSLGACDNMGTVSAYPDEEGVNKTLAVAGGVVGRMGTGTVTGCTGGEADLSGTTNEGRIIGALATPETKVALTLTPSAAEYETGRVALFTATDVPANLTVTAEPADGQEAADETDLAVEGGTLYCNLLYLADRVEGATEGVSFDDNAKQYLAAVAPYGHFTVTGESAGKALTTEEVNDALACFEGNGLVVAEGQSLKVGYAFGIVGASYKAGTLTVTAQVRDLAGNPLAFADAVGLTLVDAAATGEAIVGASAQVDEAAPGTVTFTATLKEAPETLRLAVRASTTAAD